MKFREIQGIAHFPGTLTCADDLTKWTGGPQVIAFMERGYFELFDDKAGTRMKRAPELFPRVFERAFEKAGIQGSSREAWLWEKLELAPGVPLSRTPGKPGEGKSASARAGKQAKQKREYQARADVLLTRVEIPSNQYTAFLETGIGYQGPDVWLSMPEG